MSRLDCVHACRGSIKIHQLLSHTSGLGHWRDYDVALFEPDARDNCWRLSRPSRSGRRLASAGTTAGAVYAAAEESPITSTTDSARSSLVAMAERPTTV